MSLFQSLDYGLLKILDAPIQIQCTKGKSSLLMISDGETWHYVTVKTLHGLINGAMSKYNSDC